jgi:integrase
LRPVEAQRLIECAAKHLKPLLVFLLGTGARVGEAMALTWDNVDLVAGTAAFRNIPDEKRTKSGKDRIAKLSPAAVVALSNLPHRQGPVFLTQAGRPYAAKVSGEGGGQFKTAWKRACIAAGITRTVDDVVVPRLSPHGTRHTWATWWLAACDKPTRLRDEGGWSTVALVERYAHLMKQEDVPSIALVWGVAHPDLFPAERRAVYVEDKADGRLTGGQTAAG